MGSPDSSKLGLNQPVLSYLGFARYLDWARSLAQSAVARSDEDCILSYHFLVHLTLFDPLLHLFKGQIYLLVPVPEPIPQDSLPHSQHLSSFHPFSPLGLIPRRLHLRSYSSRYGSIRTFAHRPACH